MSRYSVHAKYDKQKVPKEGTQLRSYYDTFMTNKGKPIDIILAPGAVDQLNNFYDLDIRCVQKGPHPKWMLKGAFINKEYVSFLEAMK